MAKIWLHIIGIGEEGFAALSTDAKQLIETADYIIGGARHLAMLPDNLTAQASKWLSPFEDNIAHIQQLQGQNTVILASGDPLYFGVGRLLLENFAHDEVRILPWISSITHALARMGWAQEASNCISLHGRDITSINPYLQPEQQLILLAQNGQTPKELADYLCQAGFGDSAVTVLAHLGHAEKESRIDFTAHKCPADEFPNLSIIAVKLSYPQQGWYSTSAGLPDDAYQHQGKITKAETRTATIAKLKTRPNALLWDLGAGAGSVAIEWARAGGRAIAIEQDAEQLSALKHNIARFGNPQIQIIDGDFHQHLHQLPQPEAIFIGGGLTLSLAQQMFDILPKSGRLVINAVTLESQAILIELIKQGGNLDKISVSRLQSVGAWHGLRPLMDVWQYSREKL